MGRFEKKKKTKWTTPLRKHQQRCKHAVNSENNFSIVALGTQKVTDLSGRDSFLLVCSEQKVSLFVLLKRHALWSYFLNFLGVALSSLCISKTASKRGLFSTVVRLPSSVFLAGFYHRQRLDAAAVWTQVLKAHWHIECVRSDCFIRLAAKWVENHLNNWPRVC